MMVAVIVFGFVYVGQELAHWRAPAMADWAKIRLGDSEERVREIMGPPRAEYLAASAPADYRVSGYARPTRGIGCKVLVYIKKDLVFFVYIDVLGRVEDKFSGPS